MKKIILVVFSIVLSSVTLVKAQEQVVDEVVAVVGSKIILKSDIEGQYVQYKMQGNIGNASAMKCQFLENILFEKLLLTQAEIDSIQVTDNQVESSMNQRFRYYISQFGSQQKLEEFYQKPILEIKEEIRSLVKDQLMAEQVQSKITENIKITPSEIKAFYNRMPDDSIPFIDTEYEIGQIIKQPPVSAEALSEAKEKLMNLRQRIIKGESFSTLAILYSEDPGSAKKGGELGMCLMPAVDQDEQTSQLLPFQHIIRDHLVQTASLLLTDFGITISWKVHNVPAVVDQKMIDQNGFARC